MDRQGEPGRGTVRADLIVLARESRALTQGQLATTLGLSQGHLSKIEAGLLPVADALLERIADALGYPAPFFLLTEPIYGPGASEFFHRKRQSMSARLLTRVHAQVNIRRIHVARLLQAVEIDPDRIPELDPDDFGGSVEDVARAVRAAWMVPRGPIANLTSLIEASGGIVVPTQFGTPLLDAVGRSIPGMPPLFFTNQDAPADRARLTLAHELGHMVMHRVPNPDMEAQAFRFAAEFLMPERDVRSELTGLHLDKLVGLKLVWRVSMQALLKRATDLGTIDARRARYLWMQMGKAGFRLREPPEADIAPDEPTVLAEIIRVHAEELGYSETELAALLALRADEMASIYGTGAPRLPRRRLHLVTPPAAS